MRFGAVRRRKRQSRINITRGATVLLIGRNFFSPRATTSEIRSPTRRRSSSDLNPQAGSTTTATSTTCSRNFSAYTLRARFFQRGRRRSWVATSRRFAGPVTTGALPTPTDRVSRFVPTSGAPPNLTLNLGAPIYDYQTCGSPTAEPGPQSASRRRPPDRSYPLRRQLRRAIASRGAHDGTAGPSWGRPTPLLRAHDRDHVRPRTSNNSSPARKRSLHGSQSRTYPNTFARSPRGRAPDPTIFVFDPDFENPRVQQGSSVSIGFDERPSTPSSISSDGGGPPPPRTSTFQPAAVHVTPGDGVVRSRYTGGLSRISADRPFQSSAGPSTTAPSRSVQRFSHTYGPLGYAGFRAPTQPDATAASRGYRRTRSSCMTRSTRAKASTVLRIWTGGTASSSPAVDRLRESIHNPSCAHRLRLYPVGSRHVQR